MLKKIISLLSVFAIICALFSNVAMAENENYIGWNVIEQTDKTLTAELIFNTTNDVIGLDCKLNLKDASTNGLTDIGIISKYDSNYVTVTSTLSNKMATRRALRVQYVDSSMTNSLSAGKYTLATVKFTFTNEVELPCSVFSVTRPPKEDVTSEYVQNANLQLAPKAETAEITGITIDPETVTVKGGETQEFTVEVAGTGDYDKTYALTATAGTFDGNVFTAPEATDAEQTITITATANGDSTKTATATVTVPAKEPEVFTVTKKMAADDMYVGKDRNPVKVFDCAIKNVNFAAPVVLTFKAGETVKPFNADFSAFDGEAELGFSVLMFGAPAGLTLDSITQ